MKTCTQCGKPNNRKRSEFCSVSCANANWRDNNKEKVSARMKVYHRQEREMRKPSPDWDVRRQEIINKYGATRQWLRKIIAREVLE
jgi:hypothetical protein